MYKLFVNFFAGRLQLNVRWSVARVAGLVLISGCFKLCNISRNEAGRPAHTSAPAQLATANCMSRLVPCCHWRPLAKVDLFSGDIWTIIRYKTIIVTIITLNLSSNKNVDPFRGSRWCLLYAFSASARTFYGKDNNVTRTQNCLCTFHKHTDKYVKRYISFYAGNRNYYRDCW